MDLSHNYLYEQNNNYNYPRDNIRTKNFRRASPHKKTSFINNNNILQFSLNAINSLLINNLNSSVSIGFLNLTNDINIPKTLKNNEYINSLHDTIDYKIRGNIYKQNKNIFLDNFLNVMPLLKKESSKKSNRHEIKIMKLDREIIDIRNKTPTKKLDKYYYVNLVKNNNSANKTKHFKNNSENIENNVDIGDEEKDIKKSKVMNNYDKYSIYRTFTTINSKVKNIQTKNIQNNFINQNNKAYIKKSPNKNYVINKTSLNSKEKNIKEEKNKITEPKKQISFKNKFICKVVKTNNNSPNKLIILNKSKENILKNTNKVIINNKKPNLLIKTQLPKQIKHEHSQSYNIHSYKPISHRERNTYFNSNNNEIKNNNKNTNINRNTNTNINKLNKIKYVTLTNIYKDTKENNQNNKNLNNNYILPINKIFNKKEIASKQNNKNKYVLCNKTINNSNNYQKAKNVLYFKNNNNLEKKNNRNELFRDDENSIFKVIDYTQIMSQDEFSNSKNSLTNSNKMNLLNGSNGTNTNQDTDYNSLKKFNNNNYLTNEDFRENNYYNSGNEVDINFSFNNL